MQVLKFNEEFYAATTLASLEAKGWDFTNLYEDIAEAKEVSFEEAELEAKENIEVVLRSNEDGDIFYSFLDEGNNESSPLLSGDEPKSRLDIEELFEEEKLWNVESI